MSHLFGGSKTPKPTPVTPMPDTEDPAIKEAQRKAAAAAQARSGRASTILTNPSNRGSAAAYSGPSPYSAPAKPGHPASY